MSKSERQLKLFNAKIYLKEYLVLPHESTLSRPKRLNLEAVAYPGFFTGGANILGESAESVGAAELC